MKRSHLLLAAWMAISLMGVGTIAQGAVFTIPASDSGWYDSTGRHTNTNGNYIIGRSNIAGDGVVTSTNFFVFDLSSVTGTIIGADLNLRNPSAGRQGADRTFTLFDVATPIATLVTSHTAGAAGVAIFSDLGAGTVLGTNAGPHANNATITTALNASGLAVLQSSLGGLVALGGAYVGATGTNNHLFGSTSGSSVPRELVITTANPTVPEPATLATFATLLGAGLALARRRRS
jgi:hypothetical protein